MSKGNLAVLCGKIPTEEAEAFDRWAESKGFTRSAGLRYLISVFLNAPGDGNYAKQVEYAAALSKREGVIEGIRIFRDAFSRAAEEATAKAMEEP